MYIQLIIDQQDVVDTPVKLVCGPTLLLRVVFGHLDIRDHTGQHAPEQGHVLFRRVDDD